ncbi:hypothetical protein CRN80_07345 [Pseudomonas sp. FDAARGOS_380]|nr:hypothetical protein CRN80_07345 [Pseudomonas sp. FDAARGOS_380]
MWLLALSQASQLPQGNAFQMGKPARLPTPIYLKPHDQIVGAGLPAMTTSQPTLIYLTPHDPTVGAGLLAKAA